MGTKPEFYYWEIVILMRKLSVIFATDFLARVSQEVQCLVGIILVVYNVFFIIKYQPFATQLANNTNLMTQVVHLIRIYCGIYYITAQGHDYENNLFMNIIFFLVVFCTQMSFILIWLSKVRIEILIIIYSKNRKWFDYLTCKLVNRKKFYEQYIAIENPDQVDEEFAEEDRLKQNQLEVEEYRKQLADQRKKQKDKELASQSL